MSNVFIALNGDSVGSRIGQAISNDDHEELAHATSVIQSAHDSIDQWIESIGGKKISGAGDDTLAMIPQQAIDELDSIREKYKQASGHGLTVGVGASMSQASKALVYGKLNGKNQTIHYEPSIDASLADANEDQPEMPEQDDLQDQADSDIEAEAGAAEMEEPPAEEEPADPKAAAVPIADGMGEESEDMDSEPPAGTEDDISDDNQVQSDSPAEPVANATPAQKNPMKKPMAGNTPAIDGKTGVDIGTSQDDLAEDSEIEDPAAMSGTDEDLPDTEDDLDGEVDPSADTDADTDPSAVLGDNSEDDADMGMDEEEGSEPAELGQEDVAEPNAEEGFEDAPAEDDGEDPLASMIHGDMQDDENDEDIDGVNPDADSSIDDELRQDIAEALMSFKENKDMLEQAREQNPQLYNATLTMLRSMIAMAKKLGYGPEQDMADQEAEQQLDQEFPEADAEENGEEPSEEMPNEEMEEGATEDEGEEMDEDPAQPPVAPKGIPPAKK